MVNTDDEESKTEVDVVGNFKKERKNLRRLLTNAFKEFESYIATPVTGKNVDSLFNKVEDKAERLFVVDRELTNLIELSDEEYDIIESYRDKLIDVRTIYAQHKSEIVVCSNNSSVTHDSLTLPKLDLKEYDLVPRNWVAFWGQFSRIDNDPRLKEEDKFQYLLCSLKPKTKARDIVDSYPPSKANYSKVIDHLKSRFGREDLLIEVYIRDLLALVINRANIKLSILYDQLGTYLRALETLGVMTDKYAAMLYPVVESCLPTDVLKAWDRHRLNRESNLDSSRYLLKEKLLEELMIFLRNEVESEEHRVLAENAFGNTSKVVKKELRQPSQENEPTAAALISSIPSQQISVKVRCIFCDQRHLSQECSRASSMSKEERKSVVLRKRCCLVCLKPGHFAKNCRSNVRCIICNRRHLAILCPDLPSRSPDPPSARENIIENVNTAAVSAMDPSDNIIYLKTLLIRLRYRGRQISVRALLDDGSHRSYIEKDLVQQLELSPSGREVLSQGLFGGGITPAREHGRYTVTVEGLDKGHSCQVSFLDQPQICTTLPRIKDINLLAELSARGIILTDIGNDVPPIRVLLGADILGKILTGRIEVMKCGLSAVETKFGWTILGLGRRREVINMVALSLQNIQVPKMWDLEVLGITEPVREKTKKILDEETYVQFTETLKIDEEQRYEVTLPWLAGHPALPDNYDIAKSRLRTLTKRLIREDLFESYDKVFHQWENDGIIETVSNTEMTNLRHYLPHRPVLKPDSKTTKIRPVFDASVKSRNSISLNDCLSVGPSLSQHILPLILRFRTREIGVTADIKQAFLQLSVSSHDRDVLRFLWWEDESCKTMKMYRHCRVVFGVSSSPFLLNATIQHHLSLEKYHSDELQTTVKKLREGFYVDNLVTSVDSEEEFHQMMSQAKEIMEEGKFDLRCWYHTGASEQDQTLLGLKWNTQLDELSCTKPKDIADSGAITKRSLLSVVNSIYDPIGFTCPVLLAPKLLLQEAWRQKIGWDEVLPPEIQDSYSKWIKNLHLVEQCRIPRRMFRGKYEDASLHIFTDASKKAYACCAFLRSEDERGVSVQLIAAKARVAPMPQPTIPRLELLGAAIGARLASSILEAIHLPLNTFFWTDSMVVLSWITKNEPWNTFVGNRVKEIRTLTDLNNWRFVPGDMNSADLPSRSCDWAELFRSKWWEGPEWLRNPENTWPNADITIPEEAVFEKRKTVVASTSVELHKEDFSKRLLYFSSYPKIIRMVAWMLRFHHNSKKESSRITSGLTSQEIQDAEKAVIRVVQAEWTSEQRERYCKSIQLYTHEGLLRVKSRLILSDDPEDFVHPIVLPDHLIVRRLVEHNHRVLCHSGVQTTLSCLRERFWIPRGRRIIREVLSSCMPCKRYSSKQMIPETAPLPADRVKRVAAFQVTGIDLAGPLILRGGEKSWIVLFTCGVYRAIHLELVTSLSTEAFVQSLRRFFARRGRASVLYTDNGTNFSGAARALRALDWKEIEAKSAILQIKWRFSPPAAPWYGGWWERMVRSVKELLRKNLGRACLNYEEVVTLLCDIESTINSRPLTYLSDDPNELRPLTPAHFLQDIRSEGAGEPVDLDILDSRYFLKRAQYLQSLRERLRKRFKEEYLGELIRNPNVRTTRNKLAVGDVVLIGAENVKRIHWPIGKVLELFTGKDKVQRVAKVRVANGELIRPLQRLYPLELQDERHNLKDLPKQPEELTFDQELMEDETSKESAIDEQPANAGKSSKIQKTRSGRLVKPPNILDL